MSDIQVRPAQAGSGSVLVYEYGARLDKECLPAVTEQINRARRLYNDLVAAIRTTVVEMQAYVLAQAGEAAQKLDAEIKELDQAFAEARAANDEEAMSRVAAARREKRRELALMLKETRQALRTEIQREYLSRIGKNSGCLTYAIRCNAVRDGLGWATANQVLDAAITAFKKSFARGKPPRFASGSEKVQDTLTLQFTNAGGVPVEAILNGDHTELRMQAEACGRRKYGSFSFRLGPAKDGVYATGTWQYHRPLPDGARVGLARLVRRRIGKDYRWYIQLQVRVNGEPEQIPGRKPLVTVHFGWAKDESDRVIAGIADGADPGQAHLLRLPAGIEEDLERAQAIQSERDTARDRIIPRIKEIELPEAEPETPTARAKEELDAIRRLPAQHVALTRLHRLCRLLMEAGYLPEWLDAWRKEDRLRWQSASHIARRARNRRKGFYREVANTLARRYGAIAIEPLDLAKASVKIDEKTGERTEFTRKARSGRVVVALYEFETAIRQAAQKHGTALLEVTGETASRCAYCGSPVQPDEEDWQLLHCTGCGAEVLRKANAAAVAWQAADGDLENLVSQYWLDTFAAKREQEAKQDEKKRKLAEGRKAARRAKDAQDAGSSRRAERRMDA